MTTENKDVTIKIIVNAQGVRELLKLDEAPIIELAKNAVAQVAKTMENDLVRRHLEQCIISRFDGLMKEPGWSGKLSERTQKMFREFLGSEAKQLCDKVLSGTIRQELDKHINEVVVVLTRQQEAKLSDRIDVLIRERFAAAFALPPKN